MAKIELDKYYTSEELAKYCINKTKEIIGEDNITEYLEPSAGAGVFLDYLPINILAYDIEPEDDRIIKQDYLTLDLDYKKGRCVIGNPPYGERGKLIPRFFKKSVVLGDYISFILPIKQLNNINSLYEFDLIYSEDLGKRLYSNVDLHCCLNIYRRPKDGLNKKIIDKMKDITIIRQDSSKYKTIIDYDLRIGYWGNGCAGKILLPEESLSAEYKIIINNYNLRETILEVFKTVDWRKEFKGISMLKIQQKDIYKVLRKYIPSIK